MSFDPTPADVEWMTERAMKLGDERLAKLGKGARLCADEWDTILRQALVDGEKHAREVEERKEHQALMDQRKRDEQDRAAGKPTLRASFADLLAAKGITRVK
jgi:hypothetical protein